MEEALMSKRCLAAFGMFPKQVTESVYVGSVVHSLNTNLLREYQFSHILEISKTILVAAPEELEEANCVRMHVSPGSVGDGNELDLARLLVSPQVAVVVHALSRCRASSDCGGTPTAQVTSTPAQSGEKRVLIYDSMKGMAGSMVVMAALVVARDWSANSAIAVVMDAMGSLFKLTPPNHQQLLRLQHSPSTIRQCKFVAANDTSEEHLATS
eukprot:Filipodium_phascolosomae@DN1275_c0_g1_i2.p1